MNAEVRAGAGNEPSRSWAAPLPSRVVSSTLYVAYLLASLPLIASWFGSRWPFELASHFFVQGAIASVVLIACAAGLRRRRLAIGAALLAAVYGFGTAPLEVSGRARASQSSRLRMVSANVQFDHHDAAPTLAWLQRADPDLLVLVELSPAWIQALKPVLDRYGSRVEAAHTDAYGMAVYSKRLPLRDLHLQQRPTALGVRVGSESGAFTLFAVHTPPPVSRRAAQVRDAQLSAIAAAARAAAPDFVIAGDFNATSWSPVFRNAFGGGAFNDSRAGFGVQASWPASWPAPLRIPIDHVLVGSGISVLRRELGPDVGSDHRPVLTEIGWSDGT